MKRLFSWFVAMTFLSGCGWWLAKACAPDFAMAVFSYKRHPDLPRTLFVNGKLGVLQPTFARSYLVIAYRYIKGIGLNSGEREQARSYFDDRAEGSSYSDWDRMGHGWEAEWQKSRKQIRTPVPPKVADLTKGQLAYDPQDHQFILNCADDAYRTAVHTLEQRRSRFGASSPAFRAWLTAQDTVFSNCDGGKPAIPPEAASTLPPIIRADREYQIAAAHFYAGQYPAATDGFRHISQEADSPWSLLSNYLVARVSLRAGNVAALRTETDRILADNRLRTIHGMTWNLVERANIREADSNYFRALAQLLSSPRQENGFREELWNYIDLYDGLLGDSEPTSWPYDPHAPLPDASLFQDAELSDWLFTVQSHDPAAHTRSIALWRKTHSVLWLLSTLIQATPEDARIPGLLEAAAAVTPDSPAYLTVTFHLRRLQIATGDKASVVDAVDALLRSPQLEKLPSSVNLFRGLRMMAAPDFNEFLSFALRRPVAIIFNFNTGETPAGRQVDNWLAKYGPEEDRLDLDSVRILNRDTPFQLLKEAALGSSVSAPVRQQLFLTAFTRGLMLNRDLTDIAKQLGNETFGNETSDEGKRFAAAFFLLRHPEARPYLAVGVTRQTAPGKLDDYRDNWWCPMDIPIELNSRAEFDWYHAPAPSTAPFTESRVAATAAQEFAELGKLGNAADFLGGIVLAYAADRGDDPRLPEALHWIVTAGHFGCSDVNTWKTSRDAFRLLHRNYPSSLWAKRTPVWSQETGIRQEIEWRRPTH